MTSAATIMVGVFAVFAILPFRDFKEMGIGLAAAVLIDATIVRAVLLPATMKLLGERNWYLPEVAPSGCRASSTSRPSERIDAPSALEPTASGRTQQPGPDRAGPGASTSTRAGKEQS